MGALLFGSNPLLDSLHEQFDKLLTAQEPFEEPIEGESLPFLLRPLVNSNRAGKAFGRSKHLFLTFDDGPLDCTGAILDILARNGQTATFFVIGRNLTNRRLRRLAIRALREGHELGNHSYSHPAFSGISSRRVREEIEITHWIIQEVIEQAGVSPKSQDLFFRFPYGEPESRASYSAAQDILAHLGYLIAWWDVDTMDWRMALPSARRRASEVIKSLKQAKAQDVVLLHDRNPTADVLPSILEVLRAKEMASAPLSAYPGISEGLETEQGSDGIPKASTQPKHRVIPSFLDGRS